MIHLDSQGRFILSLRRNEFSAPSSQTHKHYLFHRELHLLPSLNQRKRRGLSSVAVSNRFDKLCCLALKTLRLYCISLLHSFLGFLYLIFPRILASTESSKKSLTLLVCSWHSLESNKKQAEEIGPKSILEKQKLQWVRFL